MAVLLPALLFALVQLQCRRAAGLTRARLQCASLISMSLRDGEIAIVGQSVVGAVRALAC